MTDISKINVSFGNGNEPQDEFFSELLGKAYRGEIDCCNAVISMSKIMPFSDFVPKISDEYRKYFNEQFAKGQPLELYVYEKDGHFVMSDDYKSYFLYKEKGSKAAVCIVVGPHNITEDVKYGPPFKLPHPTVEAL